ncbi:MAG: serine/threonine protein kinase/formylglycine-generating enzyme required for sulfatase activity [Planctomycetota bacterium]|jgi:serine/threonine protein kinase/formylglycine-generating enzyme required for sulfatase activity
MSIDRDFEQLVCKIAEQALDVPAEELAGFLDRECGGRADLRREVKLFLKCMDGGDGSLLSPLLQELVARVQPGHACGANSFFRPGVKERPEPAPGLEAGKVVGDFRLLSMIGQGGMGQVWEAEQLSLGGRRIAVKFVRPERVSPKQLEYFEREARAGGRLSHPGIVAVHGYGESDGQAWIAMELVEGTWTLRDFLDELVREDELPADYDRHVARFVRELATAMHAAHGGGVIHRDLKPQNILITRENSPKVTDFGLARITDEAALSHTGDFAGTYYYMSPEQVAAKRAGIDHRTDIFSLGVLLYEMLALVRPFQGDTSHQVAEQIAFKDAPDLRTMRSRIPKDLVVIAGKALEKDRDRRFATMSELADDLGRFLSDEPILAKPPTTLDRTRKWVRRNPTRSLAACILSVAFIVIAVLSLRLAAKTSEAQTSAASAQEFRATMNSLFGLSRSADYDDLVAEAAVLWPPRPENQEVLKEWLHTADNLVAELPALLAKRDELRSTALRRTPEERQAERESHLEYVRIAPLQAEIEAKRNALLARDGRAVVELVGVDWDAYPTDPEALRDEAWDLIKPNRDSFGGEALGLALVERALEQTKEAELAVTLNVLAWAHHAIGEDEAALDASYAAVASAFEPKADLALRNHEELEAAVADSTSVEGLAAARVGIAELGISLAQLEERVDERLVWKFSAEQEPETHARWWHNQVSRLIRDLQSLSIEGTGLLAAGSANPEHGWSVVRRLALAERLHIGYEPGGEFARRWERCLPAISDAYTGLELSMQIGLVPIGMNPRSKLWEFWDVQSGVEPVRREDGQLVIEAGTGLVFVLIPGGRFWMGAQPNDPSGYNYDPHAQPEEQPVHAVELSPFFLSKYEASQGQWMRLSGADPSTYGSTQKFLDYEHDQTHPVENVSWASCQELLTRFGLRIPTEAQMEFTTRAGTQTIWWTGNDRDQLSVQRAANLADASAQRAGAIWPALQDWPEFEDGYASHAPVDRFTPNGFGLHNVHGNVWEWCMDEYEGEFYSQSDLQDPVNSMGNTTTHVSRGGAFSGSASDARSARRSSHPATAADPRLGIRPGRAIQR